jgi:GT2 family glycosyltransferase
MANKSHLVSVVLLSYDRPRYLEEALSSVVGQTYRPLEITVVDNYSPSSTEVERVVEQYKSVQMISNRRNLGFTGGMNEGIRNASGFYVHLTEDDIVLDKHCISRLVEYMDAHAETGLASGVLYNKDDGTIRCAGGHFILDSIMSRNVLTDQVDRAVLGRQPYQVTYIPGAMIFSRTALLRQLGGFREDFFMYEEDVELCARVSRSRYAISIVPHAKAYHLTPQQKTSHRDIEFHKWKNLFSLYILHAHMWVLPAFFLRYGVWGLCRSAVSFNRKTASALLRALGWTVTKIPSLLADRYRLAGGCFKS